MEPITTTIVAALAAGAAAAAKPTAEAAIKDAYNGLKTLIQRRFAANAEVKMILEKHEEKPSTWQQPLEEALTEAGIDKDPEIVGTAKRLQELLGPSSVVSATVHGSGTAIAGGGVGAGAGGIAIGGNYSGELPGRNG